TLRVASRRTGQYVGLHNYQTLLAAPQTRRAITNNMVWVAVAPTLVTALGLVLAVLTERVRLSSALKMVLFMPMAISFLAAGVTFRLVYDESPDRGALNAAIVAVHDAFKPASRYFGATVREDAGLVTNAGAVQTHGPISTDQPGLAPMGGLPAARPPKDSGAATVPSVPSAAGTGVRGVVWLDFARGGGGRPGAVDSNERGLPGMTVEAVRDGRVVSRTRTDSAGHFAFPALT